MNKHLYTHPIVSVSLENTDYVVGLNGFTKTLISTAVLTTPLPHFPDVFDAQIPSLLRCYSPNQGAIYPCIAGLGLNTLQHPNQLSYQFSSILNVTTVISLCDYFCYLHTFKNKCSCCHFNPFNKI